MPIHKEPRRPPPKIDNPEYTEWVREKLRKQNNTGYCDEDIFPEDFGKKLPDEGGWIILLMDVHVGRVVDSESGTVQTIDVPHLTVWFALPHVVQGQGVRLYQGIIRTPEGDVHVFPHEYNLFHLDKFLEFTAEDGFNTHFLSETGGFDEAAMFYLRSRGISKADAQRMLLPALKDQNYCYFSFSDEFRELFPTGTGTVYWPGRARRMFKDLQESTETT